MRRVGVVARRRCGQADWALNQGQTVRIGERARAHLSSYNRSGRGPPLVLKHTPMTNCAIRMCVGILAEDTRALTATIASQRVTEHAIWSASSVSRARREDDTAGRGGPGRRTLPPLARPALLPQLSAGLKEERARHPRGKRGAKASSSPRSVDRSRMVSKHPSRPQYHRMARPRRSTLGGRAQACAQHHGRAQHHRVGDAPLEPQPDSQARGPPAALRVVLLRSHTMAERSRGPLGQPRPETEGSAGLLRSRAPARCTATHDGEAAASDVREFRTS